MRNVLSAGLVSLGLLAAASSVPLFGQYGYGSREGYYAGGYGRDYGYDQQPRIFEVVRGHLQRAASESPYGLRGSERNRFDYAFRHLSRFQEGLARGDFRKGDLDETIEHVNDLARNNPLSPGAREALFRDVEEMRAFRARYGHDSWRYRRY